MTATGPGAVCWCGCGQRIGEHMRADARYVHRGHGSVAARERVALGLPKDTPVPRRTRAHSRSGRQLAWGRAVAVVAAYLAAVQTGRVWADQPQDARDEFTAVARRVLAPALPDRQRKGATRRDQ